MKCKDCPHWLWGKHENKLTRVVTVRVICNKNGREMGHDELDINGYPVWCPLNDSENKPQGKCQNAPETPDSIDGIPVSDLLFIARILRKKGLVLLEEIKQGYSLGQAAGYKAGQELFEKNLHEAILKMNSEPIRLEREGDFDFTKVKFEIPPYKPPQGETLDFMRFHGVDLTAAPKAINVVNPSTDGDDKK